MTESETIENALKTISRRMLAKRGLLVSPHGSLVMSRADAARDANMSPLVYSSIEDNGIKSGTKVQTLLEVLKWLEK